MPCGLCDAFRRSNGERLLRTGALVVPAVLLLTVDLAGNDAHRGCAGHIVQAEEHGPPCEIRRNEPDPEAAENNGQPASPTSTGTSTGHIAIDSQYGYDILDPTTNINRKQLLILDRKQDGTLAPNSVHVQGAVTTIANLQSSNTADKFGYLMRHPTAANQVGTTVSEAAVHSMQLGFTSVMGGWITANAELLYDPEQSFGHGTNTAIERNQVQVRRAYALLGNLDDSPFYVSLGKMAVPFGLTDTLNPFTASTVWHAFGGLANGVTLGYTNDGLHASIMGIQGGAQFRAANTPVNGTNVPSSLNNFAVDVNYSPKRDSAARLLFGSSYQRGSAYCQEFPVIHFAPCPDNNPALDAYGRLDYRNFTLKGEFARTTDEWPGTFNPAIPQFAPSRVTSFDLGARYRHARGAGRMDFSAEFSRFIAGPDGAPWERQDQLVLGIAWFHRANAKLFAEYVRVKGYAPLNFISGGSISNEDGEILLDRTHSDRFGRSHVLMMGANVAF
ncbi:MAG: hypothetical protein F4X11_14825 [Acidobacteria bacterium]|nr:hypothetical protein [Acidobacteriota bacterium]